MTIETLYFEQGSEDWFKARMGMPTASEYATVQASRKDGAVSKTRETYMRKLAGEIMTGDPMDSFSNIHMERGQAMEEEARDLYSLFMSKSEVKQVGFIRRADLNTGCSPDALVDDDGVLEIKTKLPHLMVECLLKDEFPSEHKAQCQGALWLTGREWVDILVYWPRMPVFIKRAMRDEDYIKALEKSVAEFNRELAALVEKIRTFEMRLAAA